MMVYDDKTNLEILQSIEAEAAKSLAEIRCAKKDLAQAEVRIKFALRTVHYLKQRYEEQ
jgi:hypothetical protein